IGQWRVDVVFRGSESPEKEEQERSGDALHGAAERRMNPFEVRLCSSDSLFLLISFSNLLRLRLSPTLRPCRGLVLLVLSCAPSSPTRALDPLNESLIRVR